MKAPCLGGGLGPNGNRCPYWEHAPKTMEGWQAWGMYQEHAIVRTSGFGEVMGLDLVAMIELAKIRGYEPAVMLELLGACDAGLQAALEEQRKARADELKKRS